MASVQLRWLWSREGIQDSLMSFVLSVALQGQKLCPLAMVSSFTQIFLSVLIRRKFSTDLFHFSECTSSVHTYILVQGY